MKITEPRLFASGEVVIEIRSARTNRLLKRIKQKNMVVDAGLNLIRDLLGNQGVNPLSYFAYGTSNTAAASGQTALVAEYYRAAITQLTPSSLTLAVKHYLSSTQGNGSVIREVGIFNASSSGTMYSRAVLGTPVTKTGLITVTSTWTLTWSR